MGSFDGAELCELLGLYILQILGEKYGKHKIGFYHDDGLACFGYTTKIGLLPQTDKTAKDFIKIFKEDFDLNALMFQQISANIFLKECGKWS